MYRSFRMALLIGLLLIQVVEANPLPQLFKAGGRAVFRKSSSTAARQGTRQLSAHAVKRGVGHGAKSVARNRATQAVGYFGDATVRAGGSYADDLAKVSATLSARNYRRLMMMAPELKQTGRAGHIVRGLAKSNRMDDALEALWRHRGKLATAVAMGAVVVHGDEIVGAAGEHVARPLVENSIKHLAKPLLTTVSQVMALGMFVTGAAVAIWLHRTGQPLTSLGVRLRQKLKRFRRKKAEVA